MVACSNFFCVHRAVYSAPPQHWSCSKFCILFPLAVNGKLVGRQTDWFIIHNWSFSVQLSSLCTSVCYSGCERRTGRRDRGAHIQVQRAEDWEKGGKLWQEHQHRNAIFNSDAAIASISICVASTILGLRHWMIMRESKHGLYFWNPFVSFMHPVDLPRLCSQVTDAHLGAGFACLPHQWVFSWYSSFWIFCISLSD